MSHHKPYQLSDALMFGKYEGEMLEDVIEDDPGYIEWLFENDVIEFAEDATKRLEDKKII